MLTRRSAEVQLVGIRRPLSQTLTADAFRPFRALQDNYSKVKLVDANFQLAICWDAVAGAALALPLNIGRGWGLSSSGRPEKVASGLEDHR